MADDNNMYVVEYDMNRGGGDIPRLLARPDPRIPQNRKKQINRYPCEKDFFAQPLDHFISAVSHN